MTAEATEPQLVTCTVDGCARVAAGVAGGEPVCATHFTAALVVPYPD